MKGNEAGNGTHSIVLCSDVVWLLVVYSFVIPSYSFLWMLSFVVEAVLVDLFCSLLLGTSRILDPIYIFNPYEAICTPSEQASKPCCCKQTPVPSFRLADAPNLQPFDDEADNP